MTRFQLRMDAASARAMARFGTLGFTWKEDGPVFDGNFGQELTESKERKRRKERTLVVRKAVMPDAPVLGRELLIVSTGVRWEVQSFEGDDIAWTIKLVLPKQP